MVKILSILLLMVCVADAQQVRFRRQPRLTAAAAGGSGAGPFTFIASAQGYNSAIGTTVSTSTALNLAAGDLLVAWCEWQNAETGNTVAVDENDTTDTFTPGNSIVLNEDIAGAWNYLLNSPTDASFTCRMTVSASSRRLLLIVAQFRPTSGTAVLDTDSTIATGSGTSAASNSLNTSDDDTVVIGGVCDTNGGTPPTNEKIGGVAADGVVEGATPYGSLWYRLPTATLSGATATATVSIEDWVCGIIAFK